MILTIISFILLSISIWTAYKMYKQEPTLIKTIYFTRFSDYLRAILIFIPTLLLITMSAPHLPDFLKFSILKLFNSDGANLIVKPMTMGNAGGSSIVTIIYVTIFWLLLTLCIPYLAKSEEVAFRQNYFDISERVKQSLKFGFIHMIVGVPVFIALILSVIGFLFSVRYCQSFNRNFIKNIGESVVTDETIQDCQKIAITDATSLHAKYNFIIITLVWLVTILLSVSK